MAIKGGIIYYNEDENVIHVQRINTNSQISGNQGNRSSDDSLRSLYFQSDLPRGLQITMIECHGKSAKAQKMVEGGVVYARGMFVRIFIIKCHLNINVAAMGGALYVSGKIKEMAKVYISSSNISGAAILQGGALFCERITIQIVNCSFHNEFAGQGGSVFATDGCYVNVSNCIFWWTIGIAGCIHIKGEVVLHIRESNFRAFPYFSSIVVASDNSTVCVFHSHFISDDIIPTSEVVFNLENTVKLIVFDSIFEAYWGINLRILYAKNNVEIDFIKCLFYKVSGFTISSTTTLNFKYSTIVGCISTLQAKAFIAILQESFLRIYHSNITNNDIMEANMLIYVGPKGSLEFYNSSFQKNNMSRHIVVEDGTSITLINSTFKQNYVRGIGQQKFAKGLMIFNRTLINITMCQFLENGVANYSSNLILVSGGNINIIQTTIEKNYFQPDRNFHGAALFWIDSLHTITIANSILNNNFESEFLKVTSHKLIPNNYLRIDNCSFYGNSIYVENVFQVFIFNAVLHTTRFDWVNIKSVTNVRIANTVFNSINTIKFFEGRVMLYFRRGDFISERTLLYTFESKFIGMNTSLLSNSTNFLLKGISIGFIKTDWMFEPVQKETPFASSKFFIRKSFFNHISYIYF